MIVAAIIVFCVFLTGMYSLITSKDVIKTIIALNMVQTSGILLFIFLSARAGTGLPILGLDEGASVDPLPQALMITTIVIGASITALALMMSIKLFHYYGSLDWKTIFSRED